MNETPCSTFPALISIEDLSGVCARLVADPGLKIELSHMRGEDFVIELRLGMYVTPSGLQFRLSQVHSGGGDGIGYYTKTVDEVHELITRQLTNMEEFRRLASKRLSRLAPDHPLRTAMRRSESTWNWSRWTDANKPPAKKDLHPQHVEPHKKPVDSWLELSLDSVWKGTAQ